MPRFHSSYYDPGIPCKWLRGNHHGHSTVSDGRQSPEENIRRYEDAGYHYLALSEHDTLLPVEPLQSATTLCLVPAIEVTSCFGQTLLYLGADREFPAKAWTPREIMDQVHAAGGLFIFDHPNWKPKPEYATDALLDTMEGLRGMEIYTGVIERLSGEALATDRWDRLLSKGWRVFGHGTDDQHDLVDYFIAWNCVQWRRDERVTWQGIVEACAQGRFYPSTGVTIHTVGATRDGHSLILESDADEMHWITNDGVIVKKIRGGTSAFTMEECARMLPGGPAQGRYLRAELYGHGHATAWTQPFWITED